MDAHSSQETRRGAEAAGLVVDRAVPRPFPPRSGALRKGIPAERILDVGCGEGATLSEELQLRHSESAALAQIQVVGIDINLEALRKAKDSYPQFCFVCARGERLPFRAESFDAVLSRVALPYVDIPVTLREVWRVLTAGGDLRIKVHPFSYARSELVSEVRSGTLEKRVRSLVYRLYVIANGLALHLAGFNFRYPLARRRCESFQTKRAIRRALRAAAFHSIDTSCWMTRIIRPHAGNCRAIAIRGSERAAERPSGAALRSR